MIITTTTRRPPRGPLLDVRRFPIAHGSYKSKNRGHETRNVLVPSTMSAPVNPDIYNPRKILDHPDFKVLAEGEKPAEGANIAAFYNPDHQIHLVQKPRPKPGPGQVLLHVRATGICGCALSSLPLSDVTHLFDRSDVHFWKHGAIGPMIVTDEAR
jgi:hypothetical protein